MKWILSVAIGIAIPAMTIHAHHSIAGVYDTNRQMTIEATITQFQFINPHPFVLVEVKNDAGTQPWRLEMDNRGELIQIGMNGETLKPGDRITVTGSPGRNQPQTLYIRRLDRPADGLRYEQVGGSPRIRKPR